ncbi:MULTISPECIES: enterobactin synthase subunit EntD [Citrobacter freundii complex]|uniref:enterobactin synthase subunit EntD n=1 Tax=Citrobacter freundii complex TaxID=1344959 RepID=UPI0006BD98CC|nr:enterobactin synthase subunit EntD [Citrobacter portucalensis]ALD76251.1 4'-phosphopantetheinyl transferase [enterobactin] siderophore [Citrobacter portucalensis]MBD9984741.1 enterobactin synthase subunit EntD [Citrobacter portucalensis]MBE0033621.1 enterobactin synthase subunit EntD [Citrobacter portucalensis]MBE0040523.1 enterobactin synthase subunit EntD [Citrobacter portucalensis]MBE0046482.1 enterobactin synthase subunit EntD [Citrobacter portucalensis]
MRTTHTSLPFADHALHFVEFDPASCHDHDLLWLPHHAQLLSSGRKRKAEHLAGRIAAVHALREFGLKTVPGIGTQRQPVWPQGLFGSISHSASTALAVVSRLPVGIDIEAIFTPQTATELASSIVTHAEKELLANSGLSIEQALTLAFSAKESAFKATRTSRQADAGFTQYQIVVLQHNQMILRAHHQTYRVQWRFSDNAVITLATV